MPEPKPKAAGRPAGLWGLGGLTLGQLGRKVLSGINRHDDFGLASNLAFNSILALFPLLFFLITLVGIFASHSSALRSTLLLDLSRLVPPGVFDLLRQTLAEVMTKAGTGKLTFGIVLTVWFASGGVVAMMSGVSRAYDVKESRSWWKIRAIGIGLTVAISFLIVLALAVVLAGDYVVHVLRGLSRHSGFHTVIAVVDRIAQNAIALVCVLVSFSLIYYFGADIKSHRWRWITPGSVAGVLLWVGASFGFRLYLHYYNSYSKTYGSLGVVMILLVWLYIAGLAFLVGAEVNAQIERAALPHEGQSQDTKVPVER